MERKRVSLIIVVTAIALFAFSTTAAATHPRPRGATPLTVPLVPAYNACTAPNRTHGAPLAFPSCAPPKQSTIFTTVGTPDANTAAANSIGSYRLEVLSADVRLRMSLTDIRCQPAMAASVCQSANTADGPDYSGEIQTNMVVRMTDHYNGPSLTEAGTLQDIPFPFTITCASTTSTSEGALCAVTTTFNAVIPNSVRAGNRTIWELGQIYVYDGGAGGDVGTPDGGPLVRQGLFIP